MHDKHIVRFVNPKELESFENGSHNDPYADAGRSPADTEREFLAAYEDVFRVIGEAVSIEESGSGLDADMAMSKWVDPTRVIPVVIRRIVPSLAALIEPLENVLRQHAGFTVIFLKSPSRLVLLGNHNILVSKDSTQDFCSAFGV